MVVDRCPRGVLIESLTDPANPVTSPVDWIALGYADQDPLDGKDQTKPSLTWSAIKQGTVDGFITIFQADIAHVANRLPFTIREVAPTVPIFIYNVPRTPNVNYTVKVVYSDLAGVDTIIATWDVKVI
jgi:hypothetical protein